MLMPSSLTVTTMLLALMQVAVPGAPSSMSLGAWLAAIGSAVTVLAIVYRVGQAVAKQESSEHRMNEKHNELRESVAEKLAGLLAAVEHINSHIEDGHEERQDWRAWRQETTRNVAELQTDMGTVRERTHDLSDDMTPLFVHAGIVRPERRRGDRRAS